jgi:hypothetical protein
MRKLKTAIILLMGLLAWHQIERPGVKGQDNDPCNADLLKLAVNQPAGYQQRTGRCEGFYAREVSSSTPLSVRSFMSAPPKAGTLPSSLQVSWAPSAARQIELRAQALKAKVYFQMDARAQGNDRSFDWPTDVLSKASLGLTDIGLTASYVDNGQRVYIPTKILNAASSGDGANYRVVLWPEQGFNEVFVSVTQARAGSSAVEKAKKELGVGFYPAGRPIRFSIPIPAVAGRYDLTISATLSTNVGVSLVIPFESLGRR